VTAPAEGAEAQASDVEENVPAAMIEDEIPAEPAARLEEIEVEAAVPSSPVSGLVATMREIAEGVEAPGDAELLEEAGIPAEKSAALSYAEESEDSGIAELELLGDEVAIPAKAAATVARGAAETGDVPRLASGTITDFMEIRIPRGPQDGKGPEMPPPVEVIDTSAELLEELQPMSDILPLPPEPVEEGLELLPVAEEGGQVRPREASMMISDDEDVPEELPPEELESAGEERGGAAGAGAQAAAADRASAEEQAAREENLEFEELESADEEELPVSTAEQMEADQQSELAGLAASGAVATWTIEELRGMVDESGAAIVMENGVFRIKKEVYTTAEKAKEGRAEKDLREIAHEVMQHDAPDAAPPPVARDEQGSGGIGDLLRDEDTLDLSKVISADKLPASEEAFNAEREKAIPLRLKRNGIDYDEFLTSYPRSFTHTTQMKSLVEVSRRVSAVSAGIFIKKIQMYALDLTVGLSEKSIQGLHFGSTEPFYSTMLVARKAIAINKNPSEVRFLRGLFEQEDLKYMRRMLFIPAVFRGQEAYVCLSFSGETEISIGALLSKLLVQ
jgi:hypothetical protein